MNLKYIDEPELEFGTSSHIDIKFGIMNYGVLDFSEEDAPRKIHLAIVGINDDVEKFLGWVEKCQEKISGKESRKKNLFPPFPGFSADHGFYSELVSNPNIQRTLTPDNFQALNGLTLEEKNRKAVEIYVQEIEYLSSKKNHKVDVILCAIPRVLADLFAGDIAVEEGDEPEEKIHAGISKKIDFRKLLKAETLRFRLPIQIILPSTYDGTSKKMKIGTNAEGSLQDEATRAWNFYTALYYKAGGVPWRLVRNPQEFQTCYVGISFYRSLDEETIQTSVAQVFNERGEGLIIRGANAKRSKYDKQIHLEADGAKQLLSEALGIYLREHKTRPARVVIHKTSDYDQNEIDGFLGALKEEKISLYDFLSISKSFTRLHRNGKYPPLRGTFWELDDENNILYTKGSVDLFQTYPGLYIPKSLKIRIAFREQSTRFLANEILALTKMNWNNTQLDNSMPITIKAARQVGDILKYIPEGGYVESNYSFYM